MQFVKIPIKQKGFLLKHLPIAELLAWIVYLLWATQYLYSRGLLISIIPLIIFIIIILYLAWYALKDIITGIIFKSSKTHHLNDHINIANISGKITQLGLRHMDIEDQGGRIVSIPYSRVVGSIIFKSYPSQSMLSHNFQLRIPVRQNTDVFQIMESLRTTILILPWSSQKKEPKIMVKEETTEFVLFNLTIYSLDETYFKKTEKYLQEQFKASVLNSYKPSET